MTTHLSDYDLLVIGTGSAGMAAAIRASELGATVGIVEAADVVGGTCVNIGCIPSKYLVEAAHHIHTARTSFTGIDACDPNLGWGELMRRKRELVESLRREKYLDVLASYKSIELLYGHAELLGGSRVRVERHEVTALKVVIAAGTRPSMPPIPGLAATGALDSTSVMELERRPASMIVIGAGSVGLELGQAFSRFGSRVTILDAAERILPTEDADVSATLAAALRDEDISLRTGVQVVAVERTADGYSVRLSSAAEPLLAEQLLVATGRRPNTEGLGLNAAGVMTDPRGFIQVDEFMRTSNRDVFAAGDVTGGPGFVYVAALGGGIAAQAALAGEGAEPIAIDLRITPRVTFTDPQVAAVGLTQVEARAAGIEPKVTSMSLDYLPRAAVSFRQSGIVKLVADQTTDRLLGAHIVSANAGDVIGEAVLAIRYGLTVQQVVSTLHPYLTWAEGLKLAAQTFTKDVAKLSCCA